MSPGPCAGIVSLVRRTGGRGLGLLSATRSGLLFCIRSPSVPGRLIPQFLQVSVNDGPPDTAVPAYAPIPGPTIEDGKDGHVNAGGLLGNAGGGSTGGVKDEEGFVEIPAAGCGRGVAVVDANPPLETPSAPPAPARCRNIFSG